MKNIKNIVWEWNGNKTTYEIENKKKQPGKWRVILRSLYYANKKDKLILAITIFCAITTALNPPITIYFLLAPVLGTFIKAETIPNHFNMTSEIPTLKMYGYGYILIGVLNFVVSMVQIIGSDIVSRNIMTKIKTAYLAKMLSIDISWYDKSSDQFVNTVSHDLQKMLSLFDNEMTNAIDMISFFIFGCIAGLIVSWKIALVTLGLMSITFFTMMVIMHLSKKGAKSRQRNIEKCTKIISEVLGNVRTVAAYGGEYKEIERYKNTFKLVDKYGLIQAAINATGRAFIYLLLCICHLVAYYFAVRLYLIGEFVDPGYLVVILSVQINALHNCSYMVNAISDINMATDAAYRVMSFMDTETSYGKSMEEGIKPETFNADISFRNVKFFYPTNLYTQVLQGLTLDIEPGKVTAIVGTSGTGKSTIVKLISRLYDATDGQILIGGIDIKKLNVKWLRNQIAVVGQEPVLFDTSIEENIRYGRTTATLEEIIQAAKISYAHDFINKLPSGYASIVGERGTKLSGGQKQRIAIARAIVKNPKLLLLDEATSALDFNSEGFVQEALDNAMKGRTTLIIAHRMSTVKKADVIYALKDGRVVEKGSHKELMELKGYYYSLAKFQEREEKDKVFDTNKESPPLEKIIEETKAPIIEENLKEPLKNKLNLLSINSYKVIVVWLLVILFCIIASLFLPIFYYLYSLLCQSFTYNEVELTRVAIINAGYFFCLGAIIFISVIMYGVLSTIATQMWLGKLQKKAFNKIVSMNISWFDKSGNAPNECLEIMTSSPVLIESVTGERAAQIAIFILSLLLTVSFSVLISLKVALLNLPIFIIFLIVISLRIKSRDSDARSADLTTRSTKEATEYVQNVKTIQVLNCQKYLLCQYQDTLERSKKEAMVGIFWNAAVCSFAKTLVRWSMGVLFIYGSSVVANGQAKGTSLISIAIALSIASTLAGPALMLASYYPAARQAFKKLHRIACTTTSLNTLTNDGIKPEISGNIIFQDVVFSYPTREEVQVLKKLNLKIEAGTTVALVGDSGCGKSTIISLLERFYLPNDGKILIDGNDIGNINVRYLRSQMGLVPQEPVLFDMTIKENILYGLEEEITMDKMFEAAKIANIHNVVMKFPQAYDTPVGEMGSKLSAGQKQRIAIARAILRDPKILLLDEATSALDTENEKDVQEAIENASVGRTCIVIAHRLSTIRKADKIVVLQSGVVVEEGTHEELIERRGQYFKLLHR